MGGVDFVSLVNSNKTQGTDVLDWGTVRYTRTLNDRVFYFISAENAKLFEADPWHYAPKYGGFCSWAMSGHGEGWQRRMQLEGLE